MAVPDLLRRRAGDALCARSLMLPPVLRKLHAGALPNPHQGKQGGPLAVPRPLLQRAPHTRSEAHPHTHANNRCNICSLPFLTSMTFPCSQRVPGNYPHPDKVPSPSNHVSIFPNCRP